MDLVEILLLIICFAPIISVAILAKRDCIKPLKPVDTPNLRIENMMKDADTEHYPMNDIEFKLAKKAIKKADQMQTIIAACLLLVMLVMYYISVGIFDEDMGKVYIVAGCVAYGLLLVRGTKRAMLFKKHRDEFVKKKAYVLDETMKTVTYLARKGGYRHRHSYEVKDTAYFEVIVGVADAGGNPVAFKTKLPHMDYHTTLDDKKQCDAILYKGRMVAVCNLNPS